MYCFNMPTFTQDEFADPNLDPDTFAPTGLDIDQWLDAAVAAGAKYAVLTARHIDGFCLWPTAVHVDGYDPYSIAQTDWYANSGSPDIVGLFVTKCREHGLNPCLYYCITDRTYEARSGVTWANNTPAYTAMIAAQLTELLTNYGDLTALWLDTWNGEIFGTIYPLIRTTQPNCLAVMNGVESRVHSDIDVYESTSIPEGNDRPAETVNSVRVDGAWFYHSGLGQDANSLRSVSNLAAAVVLANSRNGTYLLGVTPDTTGALPAAQVTQLGDLGDAL